ncbi:MAG: YbaN family protein [Eubacteriales bacterium]
MKIKRMIYLIIGLFSVGMGAIGAILPFIPTVPFLLLGAFCFGKSSERLDTWFRSTNLYKNNLESYVKGEGMTKGTKIKIISSVTILMGIGFLMMSGTVAGRVVLGIVWVCHVIYFVKIPTKTC